MALVAALATALAALGAALAVGGYQVGPLAVPPPLYALLLVPGVVAVAGGRRAPRMPTITLPPGTARVVRFAAIGVVLLVVSAQRVPEGAGAALTTVAALAVVGVSLWWPLPAALRASLALTTVGLLRPDGDPRAHVPALVLMGASAAVALVACSRLATAAHPVLGGVRSPPRPRRVAGEAAVVAVALLVGALFASRTDEPRQGRAEPQAGADPEQRPPEPLDYLDVLDPNGAGAGGRGGDRDTVLLKVDAERAGVLRAVTFDQWDGRRWRRSAALDGPSGVHDRFVPVFGEGFESFRGNLSEQRIRVEATYAGVAVGTPRGYSYVLPGGADSALDGTVRLVPALGKGAVYTAQTGRVDATADQLRAAGAEGGGGHSTFLPRENPNLTADPAVSDRARALAERVTAGAATDYDRVKALSDHLAATVAVGDEVAALAPGADPVDTVLFGGEPTSPERLATALAVLTRAVGIPSRLATGFLPGERPFFGGDFVVRARHAHTWVEVPFAGVGWQRFDPAGRIAAAERQDSLWSRLQRAWERSWPLVVLALAAATAYVVRRLVLRRRRLRAVPWATRYFARLVRLGARRGRPRGPSETPAEYAAALAAGVLADERLVEVGRVVTAAAWSGREPAETTRRWAEQVLEEADRATGRRRPARARSGSGSGS